MNVYSVRCDFAQDALDLVRELLLTGVAIDHVRIDRDGATVCVELWADVDTEELRRTIRRAPHGLYIAQTLQVVRAPKAAVRRAPLALPWRENGQCGDREI
jgi:hypothetical protein